MLLPSFDFAFGLVRGTASESGAGEDPFSNTESLWLGRQRGLFAPCQALGVSGSAIKRSPQATLDASADVDGFRLRGVVVQGEALTDGLLV